MRRFIMFSDELEEMAERLSNESLGRVLRLAIDYNKTEDIIPEHESGLSEREYDFYLRCVTNLQKTISHVREIAEKNRANQNARWTAEKQKKEGIETYTTVYDRIRPNTTAYTEYRTDTDTDYLSSTRAHARGEQVENVDNSKTDFSEVNSNFRAFWKAYPRKQGEEYAKTKYQEAIDNGANPEEILEGAKRYADYIAANKTQQRYVKYPSTWLNEAGYQEAWSIIPESKTDTTGWWGEE